MNDVGSAEPKPRYSLEVIWIVTGQILSASGSVVGIRLLTNTLSPLVYGEVALALTIGTFFNQIIYGPLAVSTLRFYSAALEKGELTNYFRSIIQLNYRIAWILVPIVLVGFVILHAIGQDSFLASFGFAALLSVLIGFNGILDGIQNAARRRAIVAIHQGVAQWLRFSGAALIAVAFSATSANAMLGFVIASLLILLSQSIFFYFSIRYKIERLPSDSKTNDKWKEGIWSYAWPFALFGIFCWIQIASDRWALQAFSNPGDVGLYAVVYQLGYAPAVLLHGVTVQLITPVYFARAGDGANSSRLNNANTIIKKLLFITILVSGAGFVICYFMHGVIFGILTPKAYHPVSPLLAPMFLAGGIFSAGQTLAIFHMGDKNTRALIFPKIGTALAGTCFNVLGAVWFGVTGVVWACLAFAIVYFIWMYISSAQWVHSTKTEIPAA